MKLDSYTTKEILNVLRQQVKHCEHMQDFTFRKVQSGEGTQEAYEMWINMKIQAKCSYEKVLQHVQQECLRDAGLADVDLMEEA